MKSNNQITIDDLCIDLSTLKSKEELIAQFEENGAIHSSLMDFCEEYLERYHNELCWNYPITDELQLGMFFVLVSEGVFCIPYDEADDMVYETFCIEDAKMLDADSLDNFISDWYRYDRDLKNAMYAMQTYLHRREKHEQ